MLPFTIWINCVLVALKVAHHSAFEHYLKGPLGAGW